MQHAFDIVAALFTFAAVFGLINHLFLKLPTTVGMVVIALAASVGVLVLDALLPQWGIATLARRAIADVEFEDAVMKGMLSFLLFAGALHVDFSELIRRGWAIFSLATFGVVLSTLLVGLSAWFLLGLFGIDVPLIYCLIFGALIAPTDPVAVLGILKSLNVPEALKTKIAGESLFNDGVGVVVFSLLTATALGGDEIIGIGDVGLLLAWEVLGGVTLGLLTGGLAFLAMRFVDDYNLEIIMTLALVTLTYSVAYALGTSGPLAVVAAGLFIGNAGTRFAMSEKTREHVHTFWKLIDEILNAVLFLLIGVEVVAISLGAEYLWAGIAAIPLVLASRFIAVTIPLGVLRLRQEFLPGTVSMLTWGGLRGGISVALALSLPADWAAKELILTVTYMVVIFSIVVQGTTVGGVARRAMRGGNNPGNSRP